MKHLEVILDTNPSGGCGCNCGCNGSSKIDDMTELVEALKKEQFNEELKIDLVPVSDLDTSELIKKLNTLLDKTNATFRVNYDNLDEAVSNLLPLVVLEDSILTAYGVPTLHDVIEEVQRSL